MFRGKGAHALLALLAVILLALPGPAATGTFAAAHTISHAKATTTTAPQAAPAPQARSSAAPAPPVRKAAPAFRESGCPQEPHAVRHLRDRQRGSATGSTPERALIVRSGAHAAPVPSGAPHPGSAVPYGATSPAALQVFRC
ncbi:hypothetical protein KUM39_07630 [Streptomyces sp. J2-1]|uniref:hypothetical protein n=1 Tax=Streptomyces corallincola TaxID=2851888 RepID=UPI001C388086|nr:hypothetical protein [Streptomyces corallincola]MBV2354232.1 hypothetical protein [Streptomyces corallincola]